MNDTQVDPADPKKPFSQRHLVECLREGAHRFGWSRRNPHPGLTRDGGWLVGMGVASAMRGSPTQKSAARVTLNKQGALLVETDMTDVRTGSYTIIAQIAAEMMGVGIDKVAVHLGDSHFPESPGSGGQWGAASSTAGVYAACTVLCQQVTQILGFNPQTAVFTDDHVSEGHRHLPIADAAQSGDLIAKNTMGSGDLSKKYERHSFGAHLVEVGMDVATGAVAGKVHHFGWRMCVDARLHSSSAN